MQAARKTPRIQKKAEMARGCLEEVMVQGRREEVIPQERQKMAREHQEEVMVQGRMAPPKRSSHASSCSMV